MGLKRSILIVLSVCLIVAAIPYVPAACLFLYFCFLMNQSSHVGKFDFACIDRNGQLVATARSEKEQNNFRVYKDRNGRVRIGLKYEVLEPGDYKRTIAKFQEPENVSVPTLSLSTVLKNAKNPNAQRIIYSDTGVDNTWSETGTFSEGLVPVKIGNCWGFTDINGQVTIDATYERAWSFKNGYTIVESKI